MHLPMHMLRQQTPRSFIPFCKCFSPAQDAYYQAVLVCTERVKPRCRPQKRFILLAANFGGGLWLWSSSAGSYALGPQGLGRDVSCGISPCKKYNP